MMVATVAGGRGTEFLSPPKPFPRGHWVFGLFSPQGLPKAQRQARAFRSAEDFGVLLPTPSFTQGPKPPSPRGPGPSLAPSCP